MNYTTTEEEKKKLNGYDTSQDDAGAAAQSGAQQSGMQSAQSGAQQSAQGRTVQMRYDPAADAAYQQALSALTAASKNAPTYAGTYDGQLEQLYDSIVNRGKFSYNVNDDALYRQYAQQYAQSGKLAMQDTIGQAAALTGGYGSSYGQSVGQQQYDAYLQRLNDVVPELYDRAYSRYQDEGNALYQQYSMLGDLRNQEYAQYEDAYARWANERANAQSLEQQAYERGQDDWKTGYTQALDEAETLAASGDFSGYEALYGAEKAANMRRSWISKNPDLAYRNQMISAEDYKAMTGEYPQGYSKPSSGGGGGGKAKLSAYDQLVADLKYSVLNEGEIDEDGTVSNDAWRRKAINAELAAGSITQAEASGLLREYTAGGAGTVSAKKGAAGNGTVKNRTASSR